jgi:hypothetical protein
MDRRVGLGERSTPVEHQKSHGVFGIKTMFSQQAATELALHRDELERRTNGMPLEKTRPTAAHIAIAVEDDEPAVRVNQRRQP